MRSAPYLCAGGLCALALLPAAPAASLTLEQALARAALSRPEIAVLARETMAGEGRIAQASVQPAVELDLETRNAFEESKVEFIFVHERGGKREARVAAARADHAALGARGEVLRLDIGREVRATYAAALAAEESFRLAQEAHALARSLAETVTEKVRAGAAPPIEETRAAVRLHSVAAGVERARRDAALARADLALAIGEDSARTEPLAGRLSEDTATLPDPVAAAERLAASADLAQIEQEVLVRRSVLAAEQARSSRDFSWRVAANHSTLEDEAWLTAGLTVPLGAPRNAGTLAAATAEVQRAELEHAAAGRRRAAAWERAMASLRAAAREATILRDEVLAGAGQSFATVQEGYRLGKFPYLDVLDASQVLLEARLQYTAALAALAQARIDADRLLGATGLPATTASR